MQKNSSSSSLSFHELMSISLCTLYIWYTATCCIICLFHPHRWSITRKPSSGNFPSFFGAPWRDAFCRYTHRRAPKSDGEPYIRKPTSIQISRPGYSGDRVTCRVGVNQWHMHVSAQSSNGFPLERVYFSHRVVFRRRRRRDHLSSSSSGIVTPHTGIGRTRYGILIRARSLVQTSS